MLTETYISHIRHLFWCCDLSLWSTTLKIPALYLCIHWYKLTPCITPPWASYRPLQGINHRTLDINFFLLGQVISPMMTGLCIPYKVNEHIWHHDDAMIWKKLSTLLALCEGTQIAKFMGPTWGPPGPYRPQMGPHVSPMNLAIRGIYQSPKDFPHTGTVMCSFGGIYVAGNKLMNEQLSCQWVQMPCCSCNIIVMISKLNHSC